MCVIVSGCMPGCGGRAGVHAGVCGCAQACEGVAIIMKIQNTSWRLLLL